jgi:hypothetical protein
LLQDAPQKTLELQRRSSGKINRRTKVKSAVGLIQQRFRMGTLCLIVSSFSTCKIRCIRTV